MTTPKKSISITVLLSGFWARRARFHVIAGWFFLVFGIILAGANIVGALLPLIWHDPPTLNLMGVAKATGLGSTALGVVMMFRMALDNTLKRGTCRTCEEILKHFDRVDAWGDNEKTKFLDEQLKRFSECINVAVKPAPPKSKRQEKETP